MEKTRLDYIDSLRALAAIGIVIFHLRVIAQGAPLPTPDWSQGFIYWVLGSGVQLFFVISAFLLSMLASSYEKAPRPIISFYIKRFFRIAPLFYFAIIVWSFETRIPLSTGLLLNVTFLFNIFASSQESVIFAGWTIGVEMLFYAIFPFLWRRLQGLRAKLIALPALIVFYMLVQSFVEATTLPPDEKARFLLLTIFRHLPTFLMGMIAYEVFKQIDRRPDRRMIAALLLAGAAGLFSLVIAEKSFLIDAVYWQSAACAMALLAFALTPVPGVNSVTAFLGKISYSIYLFHGLIIIKMGPAFQQIYGLGYPAAISFGLAVLLALAAIIPASAATYYLVERPGNQLGQRIVALIRKRAASGKVKIASHAAETS
jgi:peptidoglycan/LPS O-acetylase OafA/YrhL